MSRTHLLWTDIETTGLNVSKEVILELGLVVTDLDLKIDGSMSWLLYMPSFEAQIANMIPFVTEMHNNSGLIEECRTKGLYPEDVQIEARDFISWWEIGSDKTDPLCGSSVHFDRSFIDRRLPKLLSGMSYREINVSSFKETVERRKPEWAAERDHLIQPKKAHRVLPDIDDTLEEYGFYLKKMGLF